MKSQRAQKFEPQTEDVSYTWLLITKVCSCSRNTKKT